MNLVEFVNSLPLSTFDELRKTVILRYRRDAEAVTSALEYLASQSSLRAAALRKRDACEKVLSEKTGISVFLS